MVTHNTFVVKRRYPQPPETVFAAFSNPDTKRRWYAESDHHDVEAYESDFRVGGPERLGYRFKAGSPFAGVRIHNEGAYQDIVPNERIVTASTMSFGEKRISATLVTIELVANDEGTELICTHQGAFFEGADGPEIREMGWRSLFERLAEFV
jgi:uncharacterized protein YndB with AHSA1/START domain